MKHLLQLIGCWFVVAGYLPWAAGGRPPEEQADLSYQANFFVEVAGAFGHGCCNPTGGGAHPKPVGVAQVPLQATFGLHVLPRPGGLYVHLARPLGPRDWLVGMPALSQQLPAVRCSTPRCEEPLRKAGQSPNKGQRPEMTRKTRRAGKTK